MIEVILLIDARTIHYLSFESPFIRLGVAPSVRKISLIDARIAGAAAHAARATPVYSRQTDGQTRAFAALTSRDHRLTR